MDSEHIIGLERARAAAMVARNVEALKTLLHDDVVYVHATGVRHDRAQLLRFVADGPRFLRIELQDPSVRIFGDMALVRGELQLTLLRSGAATPTEACSWVGEIWRRAGGEEWRLLHFQSTSIAT
jgi:ketosteroid isomerase-like protein